MPSGLNIGVIRDPATPRARMAAEEILAEWLSGHFERPLDRIVQTEFRARHSLNSGERRWVSEVVFGTARYLRRQRWILRVRGLETTAANLVQQWHEGPREMDSGGFVPVFELPGPDSPADFLRETLAFPDGISAEMCSILSDEAVAAGEAFNRQAPTTLRVNTLRAGMSQVQSKLPQARPARFSPTSLELPHRSNIYDLPGFKEGWYELQEEASQLAAILCDAQPDETVIEVGAGSGGKSLALAAMMQNRGKLFALDTAVKRLDELHKRARRAGVRNIDSVQLGASETGLWQLSEESLRKIDNLKNAAQVVLLDAPCTGSGVMRRSPDVKWRENNIDAFARLQTVLLAQSSAFVGPGGVLVYVTCALERAQNEEVIEGFLHSKPGQAFEIVPGLLRLQAGIRRARYLAGNSKTSCFTDEPELAVLFSGPFLRTWPHRQNMDAFFAACLRRF